MQVYPRMHVNNQLLAKPIYWQVGTDANAQLLKDSLRKCGVDLSYLREIEGPSGTAMIMVDTSGKQPLSLHMLLGSSSTHAM